MSSNSPEHNCAEKAAADWILKIDRGLTPAEQDEYIAWLAEAANHREAIRTYQWGWEELDRLAGLPGTPDNPINEDLLEPSKTGDTVINLPWVWRVALPLAACITLVALFMYQYTPVIEETPTVESSVRVDRIEKIQLPDNSVIELNHGSVIDWSYSDSIRSLRLINGEANFRVAKDSSRPFLVEVAGVQVQALGTVFNIKYDNNEIGVIVTEGKVALSALPVTGKDVDPLSELGVSEQAIVNIDNDTITVEHKVLNGAEIQQALMWQPQLLEFEDLALSVIVNEFNARNYIQLIVRDSDLNELKLTSLFWSDNVEGFVRLLENNFGVKAKWRDVDTIELYYANI